MRWFRPCISFSRTFVSAFSHSALFRILGAALLAHSGCVCAQVVYDGNQTLAPFGGFSGGQFDTVALQNGNLNVNIPLLSLPQRGPASTLSFVYNTPSFQASTVINRVTIGRQSEQITTTTVGQSGGGFNVVGAASGWQVGGVMNNSEDCGGITDANAILNWTAVDPLGEAHPLNLETSGYCSSTPVSPSMDGSGLMVNLGTVPAGSSFTSGPIVVTLPDGTVVHPISYTYNSSGQLVSGTGSTEDPNGNITQVVNTYGPDGSLTSVYTDNVGHVITVANGATTTYTTPLGGTAHGYANTTISYLDSTGTQRSYSVSYEGIDVTPNLCTTNTSNPSTPVYCNEGLPTEVVPRLLELPDGTTSYTFAWVNASMGELQSITLPTGGSIAYTYTTLCTVPPGGSGSNRNCLRSVSSRTQTINGVSSQWSYSVAPFTQWATSTTVTDPANNQQVHTYTPVSQVGPAGLTFTSIPTVETNVAYYSGLASNNVLLKSVQTTYASEVNTHTNSVSNVRPVSVITTLDNGLVSETNTTYETFTYGGQTYTRLNPTQVNEYGYGRGAAGPLFRATSYTYLHNGSQQSSYVAANIVNRRVTTTVSNGQGTAIAQTTNSYDTYTGGIQTSGAANHDTNYNTYYTLRGNVTSVSRYITPGGGSLTSYNSYDDAGNIIATTDANGNTTTFNYADSWQQTSCTPSTGQARAYLSSSTNALGQTSLYETYSCSGLQASSQDLNQQISSVSYDWAGRVLATNNPDKGQITNTYYDPTDTVDTVTVLNSSGQQMTTTQVYDGVGRLVQSQLTSDPDAVDFVDTTYDGLGRLWKESHPHRSVTSSTDGTTVTTYDPLGRKAIQTNPDGTTVQWCYDNNPTSGQTNCKAHVGTQIGTWVDQTDESNNSWQYTYDAFGNMIEAMEPNGVTALPAMETDYTYDILGNLLSVSQCGGICPSSSSITRGFTYDGLSRLTIASNPESGTVSYTYDGNGNVLTKTSPAVNVASGSQIIGYCYDVLNRLVGKWAAAPPAGCNTTPTAVTPTLIASYTYGSVASSSNLVGHLIDEKSFLGGTLVAERSQSAFDPMGRVLSEQQCPFSAICTSPYSFAYTYDYLGDVTSFNNGLSSGSAGLNFGMTYDNAARLQVASVSTQPSSWSPVTYPTTLLQANETSPASYDPMNHMTNVQLGLTSGSMTPAIQMTRQYDSRGRIVSESDNNAALYAYAVPAGGYAANGNVLKYADLATGTWAFSYDTLNRLTTASAISGIYGGEAGCWTYDAFGNRTLEAFSTVTSTPCAAGANDNSQYTAESYSTARNNHVSTFSYDAAGNVLYDNQNTYLYDIEGRLCAVAINVGVGTMYEQYLYDAEGRRVGKGTTASLGCAAPTTANHFTLTNQYLRGLSGEQVTELAGTLGSVPQHSTISAGGSLLATYDFVNGGLHFMLSDPLGTRRAQVSGTGFAELSCISLPFGNNIGNTRTTQCSHAGSNTASDAAEMHFTAKERDTESGLDYFGARYMSSSMGRFMSPDPVGGSLSNPQTLNRYAYVVNNPLRNTDPTGLDCVYKGDSAANSTVVRGDCLSDDDDGVFVDAHVDSLFDKGNDIWANVSAYTDQNNPYGGTGTPSTDPDDARIMQLAQGINQYAGALNNPSTYVAWYGASLVGAVGVLSAPAVISSGVNASGLLGGSARVFFSGAGAAGASAYAAANNAVTLTMTPLGRFADYLNGENGIFSGVQNNLTYAAWAQLSTWFAQGAEGTATFFEGAGGYQGSVWFNYEMPILVQRGIPIVTVPHP